MLIHLAAGGGEFHNPELFTKEMLIHLAAGGESFQNSELFTKGMLIHLAAGGEIFKILDFLLRECYQIIGIRVLLDGPC